MLSSTASSEPDGVTVTGRPAALQRSDRALRVAFGDRENEVGSQRGDLLGVDLEAADARESARAASG